MRALPPAEVRARFHAMGVPTVEEPELEKVFPASQRAIDVRDALLERAREVARSLRAGAGTPPAGAATASPGSISQ